jgi:6-phosphogluconolactonase
VAFCFRGWHALKRDIIVATACWVEPEGSNMSDATLVFVGTLNRAAPYFEGAHGEGILVLVLDEATGRLTLRSKVKGIDNPTYLSVHEGKACLYATSEVFGWNEGTVTAYAFDRSSGALTYINKQPALGSCTSYSSVDRSGRFLLVANYAHEPWSEDFGAENPGQAVVVYPLKESGGLKSPVCSVAHQGSGPVADRQERPHPHSAVASPDNRFVVVPDLGIDKVMCYRFEDGQLTLAVGVPPFTLPAGSGPRHFVFAKNGTMAYVINELGSTVAHLHYDALSGKLETVEIVSTLPDGFQGENRSADLHLSPDERFLYGSNRGHDSIVIYAVDADTGRLTLVGHVPTEGRTPRNFAISPSGRFVLVANQNGDSIVTFRRETSNGLLHCIDKLEIGSPMCIKMLPLS